MPRFLSLLAAATVLAGGISVVAPGAAFAQTVPASAALTIGSPAPKLPVAEWVKGTPVKLGDGKIHVVEFWATWCGPCKVSIPHLTQMSKKYAGKADFTGVSVWERGEGIPAKVKAFVNTMGAQMDYHVARDDAKNTIAQTWMAAANQNGIPTAFIVDKTGKVVWIGHPMDNLDETLGKVIAGKYDMATAKAEYKKKQAEQAKEEAEMAAEQAKQKAKNAELDKVFGDGLELAKKEKFPEAIAAIDKALETNPQYAADVMYLEFRLYMKYDEAAAQKFAAKSVTIPGLPPQMLNEIAWGIVAPDSTFKTPDYTSAVTVAEAAVAATKEQDPSILDTLSYAYEKNGSVDKAVATEAKAVALLKADDTSDMAKELKARLVTLKTKQK